MPLLFKQYTMGVNKEIPSVLHTNFKYNPWANRPKFPDKYIKPKDKNVYLISNFTEVRSIENMTSLPYWSIYTSLGISGLITQSQRLLWCNNDCSSNLSRNICINIILWRKGDQLFCLRCTSLTKDESKTASFAGPFMDPRHVFPWPGIRNQWQSGKQPN